MTVTSPAPRALLVVDVPAGRTTLSALLAACVLAPAASAATTEFPLPSAERFPIGIAAGPDGAVWVAVRSSSDAGADRIARVSATGAVTEHALPPASDPSGIALGPDGAMWFAETGTDSIGRIATDGTITRHALSEDARPLDIVAGPDGALWFTESEGANRIGRITTAGELTEICVSCGSETAAGLHSIAAGPDGALWFTMRSAGRIGRVTVAGVVSDFAASTPAAEPMGIAAGPDGNLWFTESGANRIARLSTSGTVSTFSVPTADSRPTDIVAGPDGRMWFTEYAGNRVGRVAATGEISESGTLAAPFSGPNRIALGPGGGSLWFSESGAAAVGRVTPEPAPVAVTGAARTLDLVTAEVDGTVDPNGAATSYWFEFGIDTAYGGRTDPAELGAGTDAAGVTGRLSGLTPGYDYHYRLVAQSPNGVSTGADRTFTIQLPAYEPPPPAAGPEPPPPPPEPAPEPAAAPPARPAISGLRAVTAYFDARGRRRRGLGLRFRLNVAATVRVSLERHRSSARPLVVTYRGRRGRNVIRLGELAGRRLRRGFYDATLVASSGGRLSSPAEVLLVVPRALVPRRR